MSMEQVQFNYSLKNIPIPTDKEYLIDLISSVNTFMSNIKWRSFHFLNRSNKSQKETYGFKTTSAPPNTPELKHHLKEFESELYMIL